MERSGGRIRVGEDREGREIVGEEEEGENGKRGRGRGEEREGEEKRRGEGRYRVGFWNVAGLKNKDRDFWEGLKGWDIMILCETWVDNKSWRG